MFCETSPIKNNTVQNYLRLALLCLFFLIILSLCVKIDRTIFGFNLIVHEYMMSWHSAALNIAALLVSFFGDKYVIYPVIAFFALWLFTQNQTRLALHWISLIFLSAIIIHLLKAWVASPRPTAIANIALDYSFPSGHVTIAAMWCGFLYVTIAPALQSCQRYALSIIGCLIPFLVLISRVYIGAHWPTDVEAGLFLGIFCYSIVAGNYVRKPVVSIVKNQIRILLLLFIVVSIIYLALCHQQLANKFLLRPSPYGIVFG